MTNVKLQVNSLLAVVRKCTFAVTFIWQIDREPKGYSFSVLSNTFCYQQTCSLISQNYCLPIICDQAVKTREFKISYCHEFQNLRRSFALSDRIQSKLSPENMHTKFASIDYFHNHSSERQVVDI